MGIFVFFFNTVLLTSADRQHRPLSCQAPLRQISRPGVAPQLGRHGEELPDSPSKSNNQQFLFISFYFFNAQFAYIPRKCKLING